VPDEVGARRQGLAVWSLHVVISLALTIAVATVSYYAFERFFLRLKAPFMHVESQPLPGQGKTMDVDAAPAVPVPGSGQA
jgi:peptidoglycan/LPS O-acetylase OafA/YrhL